MSPRPALVTGLAGAFLLSLAACSGGGGGASASGSAAPSSAASSSAAPSSSVTATTPAMAAPDPKDFPGMDEKTEDGAKQAYRYFWQTYFYMRVTGDTQPFSKTYTTDCGWCSKVQSSVKTETLWKSFKISHEKTEANATADSDVVVFYDMTLNSRDRVNADGKSVTPVESSIRAGSVLIWQGGKWKVDSVDLASRDDDD